MEIKGKGNRPRLVACPGRLTEQLQAYAYRKGIGFHDRFFPISRKTAWYVISQAGKRSGLGRKVYCHLLRHPDAIERLRQTGNPRALQLHLGHSSQIMTMRYLSTLTVKATLRIQQEMERMSKAIERLLEGVKDPDELWRRDHIAFALALIFRDMELNKDENLNALKWWNRKNAKPFRGEG